MIHPIVFAVCFILLFVGIGLFWGSGWVYLRGVLQRMFHSHRSKHIVQQGGYRPPENPKDYTWQQQHYEEQHQQAPTLASTIQLAWLYHYGVASRYDQRGNTIEGVEPNIPLALTYYQQAVQRGWLDGALKMAEIYQWGIPPIEPQPSRALQIYQALIAHPKAPLELRQIASTRLSMLRAEMSDQKQEASIQDVRTGGSMAWTDVRRQPVHWENMDDDMHTIIEEIEQVQRQDKRVQPRVILSDGQNVHDHATVTSLQKSIDTIKKHTPITISVEKTIQDIRALLSQQPDCDKKKNAIKSLDSIERSISSSHITKITECETLQLVWNRIHQPNTFSDAQCNILYENLMNELANMVEHGHVVCSTGKRSRMVDTLIGMDESVSLKPTFAVREEMLNRASVLRDEVWNKYTPEQQAVIIQPTPSEIQTQYEMDARQHITKTLYDEYVDSELLTSGKFHRELDAWLDAALG